MSKIKIWIEGIAYIIMIAIIVDVMIVMWTMLILSEGKSVPHIPFWDNQIGFVVSLLK